MESYSHFIYCDVYCSAIWTILWSSATVNTYHTVCQEKLVKEWSSHVVSPHIPLFLTFICPHMPFFNTALHYFIITGRVFYCSQVPTQCFWKGCFHLLSWPTVSSNSSGQQLPIFSRTGFSNLWAMCRSAISYSHPVMQCRALPFLPLCPLCTSLTLPLSHSCFQFFFFFFFCIQPCLCECVSQCVIHDVCCLVLGRRPRWHL